MRKLMGKHFSRLMVGMTLLICLILVSGLVGANRAPVASNQANVIQYTYDDAGRLVQVDYSNGARITYTYDNAGNLLRREIK
jgi:YD repeat-containing protein